MYIRLLLLKAYRIHVCTHKDMLLDLVHPCAIWSMDMCDALNLIHSDGSYARHETLGPTTQLAMWRHRTSDLGPTDPEDLGDLRTRYLDIHTQELHAVCI